jgi:GT2 family glycosyltransferase
VTSHEEINALPQSTCTGRVGVILVNWNGAELTIPCIESLLASSYSNFHIIVVDDGSTDGSADRISQRFPGLELLRQPANLGLSKARNRGIERALELGSDYVLILDNDTRVDPDLIANLLKAAAAIGEPVVVGPKIYWLDYPDRLWFAYGRLSLWTGIYSNAAYNHVDHGQFDRSVEMDVGSGCCMLIPKEVFRAVGSFDETYGRWAAEDVDWCLRCRRVPFRIVYSPKAKVWHRVSGSADKMPRALTRFLATRNQLWSCRRLASSCQMCTIALLYPFRATLRIFAMITRRQWECIWAELRGARDGFLAPLRQADNFHTGPNPRTPLR